MNCCLGCQKVFWLEVTLKHLNSLIRYFIFYWNDLNKSLILLVFVTVDWIIGTSNTVRSRCSCIWCTLNWIPTIAFTASETLFQTKTFPNLLKRTVAQARIVLREAFIGIRFCTQIDTASSAQEWNTKGKPVLGYVFSLYNISYSNANTFQIGPILLNSLNLKSTRSVSTALAIVKHFVIEQNEFFRDHLQNLIPQCIKLTTCKDSMVWKPNLTDFIDKNVIFLFLLFFL